MAWARRRGRLDVVADLAGAVGGGTVADLLGLDLDAAPYMLRLSHTLFKIADHAPALASLKAIEAVAPRGAVLHWILGQPGLDPIRADPRFQRVWNESDPAGAR